MDENRQSERGAVALDLVPEVTKRYLRGDITAAAYFSSGADATQRQAEREVEVAMDRYRRPRPHLRRLVRR